MLLLLLLSATSSAADFVSNSTGFDVYSPPLPGDGEHNAWSGRLLAEEKKPKRKFCNTSTYKLKGDYAYEACGEFCKEIKAKNHCKFCKCKACAFCKSSATAGVAAAASLTKNFAKHVLGAKKKKKAKGEGAAGGAAAGGAAPVAGKGKGGKKKGGAKGAKRRLRKLKEASS